jgi:hypothetical protein
MFPVVPPGYCGGRWPYFGLGAHVKKVTGLNSLYQLGFIVSQLRVKLSQPSTTVKDVIFGCGMVHAHLNEMLHGIPLPFEGSGKIMKEVIETIDSLKSMITTDEILSVPIYQTLYDYRLNDAIIRLESVLSYELDTMPIWFVTARRAYSIDVLINNAEQVLDPDTIRFLSPRTILDLRQAGRSIAFEVPTAAGFHSLRATEGVARGYHEIIIGIRADEGTPLGPLINALRIGRDALVKDATIDGEDMLHLVIETLARLNNVYRKPIMHPDMVLDLPGAINVFDTAKNAIALMLEDAGKKSSANLKPDFF